jgi:hypothetical protein
MADLLASLGSPLSAPHDVAAAMDMDLAGLDAVDWAWDAPVDAAEEMRALLEMWPTAPTKDGEGAADLDLDLGRYIDSAALGLDGLGVAPASIGAY